MRPALAMLLTVTAPLLSGCGLEQVLQSGTSEKPKPAADGGTDAGATTEILGAGCGVESGSGAQLCLATSACPKLVIDKAAMPHCGFRIRGSASELLCGCGDSICSMGAYTTCAQAATLLSSQTELQVCTQLSEGRCSLRAPSAGSTPTNPACDRQCVKECGGGSGCASLCGC